MLVSGICLQAALGGRCHKETVKSEERHLVCLGSSKEFRAGQCDKA